jgi:signal transduction histidine kinase
MLEPGLDAAALRRLMEVGRAIAAGVDRGTVFDQLLDVACDVTSASLAEVELLSQEGGVLEVFSRGNGDRGEGAPLEVEVSVDGAVAANVRLTPGERLFGLATEETMEILAGWTALVIRGGRDAAEIESLRGAADDATRASDASMVISRAIGMEADLDRVFAMIVDRGRRLVDAGAVVLLLVEDADFEVAAASGRVDPDAVGGRFPARPSLIDDALGARRPERVADVSALLWLAHEHMGVPDAETALIIPLVHRGRALGALVAFDRTGPEPRFGLEEQRLLMSFADTSATALVTARTVTAERLRDTLSAAELERKRWARELHDSTLQGLGGLRVVLTSALRFSDEAILRQVVAEATDTLSEEITGLRSLITELRPAALDDIGLAAALETFIERYAVKNGFDVRADIDVAERLEDELETVVYRIVQEALANAARHASPTILRVKVAIEAEQLIAEIADDGAGFDPLTRTRGFGMLGMRERAELLGGELEIDTAPGKGTTVRATLPKDL